MKDDENLPSLKNTRDSTYKIQRAELEILKEFVKICEENGLQYFLVAGTLLGSVRHSGFIPWDDDIDVAMPREDFDEFFHVYKKKLPGFLYTQYFEEYPDGDKTFPRNPRICGVNHKIEVHMFREKEEMNPFIDVFSLDGMPRQSIRQKLRLYHLIGLRVVYKFTMDSRNGVYLARSRIERIGIFLSRHLRLGRFMNTKEAFSRFNAALKKVPYGTAEYVVMSGADYRHLKIWPKSYYGKGRRAVFEDMEVCIPEQAEKILESMYGDYMRLPPEEERNPKHGAVFIC